MGEKTIPVLPCQTLLPVLDFYVALGFEVTFQQRSPHPYAVVERGGIQLHFFGMKHYEPASSYSTCVVRTDDVDRLHAEFRSGLKAVYGRVPSRGLPRIGALRDTSHGVRQFLVTDPGGNCLRVGQPIGQDLHHRAAPKDPFGKALHHAALLADSKEDPEGAARVLDRALRGEGKTPSPAQLFRLLVLRGDVALRLGDDSAAAAFLAQAAALDLTPGEREAVRDDLGRLEEMPG
ncbi:VOC family protein [Streptomyces sp. HUAS MG47]|uniref:bleomycin resistance protein n=1 Tax=Streptomyces solicamelliae TaxID=3231716 RepID=UPI003877A90E